MCYRKPETPTVSHRTRRRCTGFTLIEMIGVLAIIAILASLLIPKIFESINNARLTQTQLGYQTVKTAVIEHFAKFNSFNSSNGVTFTVPSWGYQDYDKVLLGEGLLDKLFLPKIDFTSSTVQIRDATSLAGGAPDPSAPSSGFDLNGDGSNDILNAQYLVEVLMMGVNDADARALNDLLDGPSLGEDTNSPAQDRKGRVVYDKPTGSNPRTLRIYISHK